MQMCPLVVKLLTPMYHSISRAAKQNLILEIYDPVHVHLKYDVRFQNEPYLPGVAW